MQKQIIELLETIAVFDASFKKQISQKMAGLEEYRLAELKKILLEVQEWQLNFLKKKITEDPDFYDRIMEAKRQAEHKVIELYKQKFAAEDHRKIEIILNKIKEL